LVYPAVPTQLSSSFGNLVSLKTLKIIGNSAIPCEQNDPQRILPRKDLTIALARSPSAAGNVPSNLFAPVNLSSIDIESTALVGPLSSTAFNGLDNLLSLALVSNAKLGTAIPSMAGNSKLLTLWVFACMASGLQPLLTWIGAFSAVTGQSLTGDPFSSIPSSVTYLCVLPRGCLLLAYADSGGHLSQRHVL
jgi:hypothetical protein